MATYFLTYLTLIPSAAIFLFPMRNQFRYGLRGTIGILCGLFALAAPLTAFLSRWLSLKPNTTLTALLLLLFFVSHRCLRAHISKSLSAFCSMAALMSILANYAACFDAIRHPTLGADAFTVEYSLFFFVLGLAAAALLFYPLWKYESRLIDGLDSRTVWYLTVPFFGLLLGINLFFRMEKYETYFVNNVARSVHVLLASLLILWLLLHVVFYLIVMELKNAEENRERVRLLEMQESQYVAQQRYMEAEARTRHDFRQMIRTIQGLTKARDWEALENFVTRYAESLPESGAALYTRNRSLNALLNYYAQRARENHIRAVFKIALPETLSVSDNDLCGMAGNILENAVAACQEIPEADRTIQLAIRVHCGRNLILVATNAFNGNVRMKNGQYYSIHRNGRGIGLSSIRSTAERYGGMAEFSHDAEKFYISVMIPVFDDEESGKRPV